MKVLSKDQEEFEFLAHRRGLSLKKREGAYEENITAEMWYWWQVVRSNEPRELLDEWNVLVEESKKWKGKLDILKESCAQAIDKAFEDTSWEAVHMRNDSSPQVVSGRKAAVKKWTLRTIEDLHNLIGVEWLVCGVSEENHKRVRAKVRGCLGYLSKRCNYGYELESITQEKVSAAVVKQTRHGMRFSDEVMRIARERI